MTLLDLSFNQLTTIDDVILRYPKLSALYLHANKISDISQVAKLAALPLRALTLQANPMEALNKGLRSVGWQCYALCAHSVICVLIRCCAQTPIECTLFRCYRT